MKKLFLLGILAVSSSSYASGTILEQIDTLIEFLDLSRPTKEKYQTSAIQSIMNFSSSLWKGKADSKTKALVADEINWRAIRLYEETAGTYAPYKMMLDHSYHGVYSQERQAVQDDVIDSYVLDRPTHVERPVVIFTGGAMGVGKGYSIEKMKNLGFYVDEDFVVLDYDDIKKKLPEFKRITDHQDTWLNKKSGDFTHAESAFIGETIKQYAIANRQNIIVDGSLNDFSWFKDVFNDFRSCGYTIKIVYVKAKDIDSVYSNAVFRAKKTGRFVSKDKIKDSLTKVESSVAKLQFLADVMIEVIGGDAVKNIPPYLRSVTTFKSGTKIGELTFDGEELPLEESSLNTRSILERL